MTLRIVSGSTNPQLYSHVNHWLYADRHGYDYQFDHTPSTALPYKFFFKLDAVTRALPRCDWVFWLDDDAFVTDFARPLEPFIQDVDASTFLVICKSPVNPRGRSTFLNSGVFFLKNCPDGSTFLDRVMATHLDVVKAWWKTETFGMFTGGDQDAITYVLHEHRLLSGVSLMPYDAFNNRPYHYQRTADEHFIVHFPGVHDKAAAIADFARRYHLDARTLVPHHALTGPWRQPFPRVT